MADLRKEVVVAVGSTNPVKVDAVKKAFTAAFSSVHLRIAGVSAPSGVSDQPSGDLETREGAKNRASNSVDIYAAANGGIKPDFAVGLEGGCGEEAYAHDSGTELICFAWMAVLHVSTGKWGIARTGSFMLPPAVAELVRGGMELGHADDKVFGRSNSKQQDGAVGILSNSLIDRTHYYMHALTLALIPFISAKHYGNEEIEVKAVST